MQIRSCPGEEGVGIMLEGKSRYSPDEILEKIAELGKEELWFHCIDLGNGIKTMQEPVPHLDNLWIQISKHIPNDLSGKSVLDIGCNAGFFSVQAKKRNADYVLGIDLSDGFLKQAEFVREVLGLEIDYEKMGPCEVAKLGGKFDIVFCLGVIYHCADPFQAARCVEAVTGEMAVVESQVVRYEPVADKPLWEFVFPGYTDLTDTGTNDERRHNWWFPNLEGLRVLFQSAGFRKVESVYEAEDRGIIICFK